MHPGGREVEVRGARFSRAAKRSLDLTLACVLLLLALPVILLATLAVLIVDGRPVIFTQEREGLNGASFRLLKVRTMRRDAKTRLAGMLASDPALSEEWDRYLCLRNDPRVLPYVGRFLRRTSIDELPQLVNVLTGDMSLVGPRPLSTDLLAAFPPEHIELRRQVKPGLTGLWQVCGRSTNDLSEWIRLDEIYVRTRSLRRDVGILLRTPYVLLSRNGAN